MDKVQSLKIIKNTFENKFEKEVFIKFIVELLNLKSAAISDSGIYFNLNTVPNTYKPYISSFEKITSYHQNGSILDILIIKLQKHTSIEKARTMQRNFIAWYLKGGCDGDLKDAALAAFVSPDEHDWRFSLIRMEYSVTEDKKGAAKLIEQFSPAKRWSFLVGANEKSHTAQAQLIDIVSRDNENIKISEIEEAFSVEKVTKEFFTKYRELFFQTKDALDEIIDKDMKVKSDFESKNISTVDFAKKLLGQIVFLYFLQKKGWFGVARDAEWGTGPKNFIRELFEEKHGKYTNFFNNILEPLFYEALRFDRSANYDYYDKFSCKIPFLNGGLFDPIGEYDWVHTDIKLPNELFSNSELTKDGTKGTGIIDIFDRYNFTVQEDEPLEKEVAVDPEMLGKVFENLLEVKDRKSKGTYYTPREIVHYMCQQSLINYLSIELENKVRKEDIEVLIKYGGDVGDDIDSAEKLKLDIPTAISENAFLVDEKLSSIKVCDPAVGSGAFLVGMMSEIIRTRNILSRYIAEPCRSIYDLKRDCIENSLYGVDIDPGAVEICKLRLWLSLIVDEEDIRNIKPLPNLDFKIVCGNSLLDVEVNLFNQEAFNKLEELKPGYFKETNIIKKKEFKKQINELIGEITNGKKDFDFKVYFSEVFHLNDGFDLVIGNPPYDVYEGHRKKEIEIINKMPIYDKAKGGKLNAYKIFLAKSIELQKNNGFLCEIFQNSFLADNSATNLRKFFLGKQQIIKIDSFPERDNVNKRVFESVKMSVCILISCNSYINNYSFQLNIWEDRYMSNSSAIIFNNNDILKFDQKNAPIPTVSKKSYQLLNKLSKIARLIKIAHCFEGEINLTFHKEYLKKEKNGNVQMIKGAAVQKWFITSKMSQGEVEYLDINSYLKENQSPKSKHFEKERIVMQGITGVDENIRLKMTIIEPGIFCGNSVNYIILNSDLVDQKYLIALLNSSLLNWFFKIFSTNSNVNGYEVDNLPIPIVELSKQKVLVEYINEIYTVTENKDYLQSVQKKLKIKEYENKIDQIVYDLYGLTAEEIEIIESVKRN